MYQAPWHSATDLTRSGHTWIKERSKKILFQSNGIADEDLPGI